MMEKDKETLENRKRAREEEEKRKVEEEKRRKLARDQRQSDLCSGRQNPAMKTAGILPLTNKNWASSARKGKLEEAIAEEARRHDQRKSLGLSGEAEWKNYLMIIRKKGLKDCDSLDETIAMLRRASAGDSQVLYVFCFNNFLLSDSQFGKTYKLLTPIKNPEFREKLRKYVKETASIDGKANLTSEDIAKWVNVELDVSGDHFSSQTVR